MTDLLLKAKNLLNANKKPVIHSNIEREKSNQKPASFSPIRYDGSRSFEVDQRVRRPEEYKKSEEDEELESYLKGLTSYPVTLFETTLPLNQKNRSADCKSGSKYLKNINNQVESKSKENVSTKAVKTSDNMIKIEVNENNLKIETANFNDSALKIETTQDKHVPDILKDIIELKDADKRISEHSQVMFKHKPEFGNIKSIDDLMASSESEISECIENEISIHGNSTSTVSMVESSMEQIAMNYNTKSDPSGLKDDLYPSKSLIDEREVSTKAKDSATQYEDYQNPCLCFQEKSKGEFRQDESNKFKKKVAMNNLTRMIFLF